MNEDNNKFDFFCSWSGGKDSCLALHRVADESKKCRLLFTMVNTDNVHSKSHNLTMDALQAQAHALGCEFHTGSAEWGLYEEEFIRQLQTIKNDRLLNGVFGDIDLEPHREWVERVCGIAGITAHEPLWLENRKKLVEECVELGIKSKIVVVNTEKMPVRFLGREIDNELADELEAVGVDACGENGEYHSYVYEAPLFSNEIRMVPGKTHTRDNYAFLDFTIA